MGRNGDGDRDARGPGEDRLPLPWPSRGRPGRWIVSAIVLALVAQIVHGLATHPFFEWDRFQYWFPRPDRQAFAGSPATAAETINDFVQADASDGFILVPHITPGGLDAFADTVVPLLQERGVFRTEYEGTTLHDHLGLAHPDTAGTRGRPGPPVIS